MGQGGVGGPAAEMSYPRDTGTDADQLPAPSSGWPATWLALGERAVRAASRKLEESMEFIGQPSGVASARRVALLIAALAVLSWGFVLATAGSARAAQAGV